MYCHECGKSNPEEAKFCAFCGTRLIEPVLQAQGEPAVPMKEQQPPEAPQSAGEPAVAAPAPVETGPDETAPKPEPHQRRMTPPPRKRAEAEPSRPKPDPHQAYRRPPSDGNDVRPVLENPAQPMRGDPIITEPPVIKPAVSARRVPGDAPARREPELPKKEPQPAQRRPQHAQRVLPTAPQPAVTASGGEVMPPSRAPNVKKPSPERYAAITSRKPGTAPFTATKDQRNEDGPDDLFFEDDEPFEEEDALVRHLKSIIAVLFLVLVVGTLGWLFLSKSGQLFRAGIGVSAPADAYFELGKQREGRGELQGAADAYYSALKLDPDNYLYAMQVGVASEKTGDNERAVQAYRKCIDQRDNLAEPYKLLVDLLERMGNIEAADQWRRMGYEKTGDEALKPATAGQDNQEDIVDAMA